MAVKNIADKVLKYYADKDYCIASGLVDANADNADLKVGTVMGQLTANDRYTILDPGEVDGSGAAVAILLEDIEAPATGGHQEALFLVRGPALVINDELVYPAGITAPQQTTAEGELEALLIHRQTGI